MPEIEVNGATIFYRAFGRATRTPIVLIHGAMADGEADWGSLAPLLGLQHHVIVPDCRGHGRSSNPRGGYAFAELASDMAVLVRQLGFEQAHVVGHSNGGNVALLTVLDHPTIVASAIIQAANAFVSDDLREREPVLFDPDRVERDDPAWRDELVRLHGPTHGPDYWRTLLRITGAETCSAPNLGPADLAGIDLPVLVIEGQDDTTNATAGHGAFIGRHIPFAEVWRPAGVGHSVHEEQPLAWLGRAEGFWARRGDRRADRIWRLGREHFADSRTTVFDLRVDAGRVEGTVLEPSQAAAVAAVLDDHEPPSLRVLRLHTRPAIVAVAVADVLAEPTAASERLTQALVGEQVEMLEDDGRFVRVRLATDSYLGWMRRTALVHSGATTTDDSTMLRIVADVALARSKPDGAVSARIPFGARLPLVEREGPWVSLAAPDGSRWWVRAVDTGTMDSVNATLAATLARFEDFVGIPYLWGGRTPFGFDCSGLSQAFHAELGRAIPRDADQQWAAGRAVDPPAERGDLLFFHGNGDETDDIVHVGIALGGADFLHAWAAVGCVAISSLDPASRRYSEPLQAALAGVRRFLDPTTPAGEASPGRRRA